MTRPIQALRSHLRANLVGYLALFVALGGTSYAALNIPRNSVGTRQLRAGAVTAKKLDRHSIAGYVAFWAVVDSAGRVRHSSVPATTVGWSGGLGTITFHGRLSASCFPLANIGAPTPGPGNYVTEVLSGSQGRSTSLQIGMIQRGATGPQPVDVAEICPSEAH